MRTLKLLVVTLILGTALFVASGVAFAGGEWCDWGSPPPMDAGLVANPVDKGAGNPHGMPTPLDTNTPDYGNKAWSVPANAGFTSNTQLPGAYLPPGMSKAVK